MERQREAAGGAPAGGHVTWARRRRNQSRISSVASAGRRDWLVNSDCVSVDAALGQSKDPVFSPL